MVRLLIAMKLAQLRHQKNTLSPWVGFVLVLLGAVSAVSTLLLGFVGYPSATSEADVLALVFAVWMTARVAFTTFAGGDVTLRPEFFRLLPLPRGRLAWALLVVGVLDPSLVFLTVALSALIVFGFHYGVAAGLLGVAGVAAMVVLSSVLATVVGGLVAPPDRRRQGAATLILAVLISVVALSGPLIPSLASAMTHDRLPALSLVVRALPSGWAPDAVALAARRSPLAAAPVASLVVVIAGLMALWPTLLRRRLTNPHSSSRHPHRAGLQRRLFTATPAGAVASKELRQWARDPIRATLLLIAAIVGLGSCVIPYLAHGTSIVMPFAGILTVVIAGAVACNLLGADGLALTLSVLTPHSAAHDVRGRQLAWLLILGPYVTILTILTTAWSGQGWAWPWVLAVLPALLGGAAGLIPLASVVKVQPLNESGGLTPGWPIKIYLCLALIVVTAAPAAAVLAFGAESGTAWISWLAVPVGVLTGATCAILLTRRAARILQQNQVDILTMLMAAASPA